MIEKAWEFCASWFRQGLKRVSLVAGRGLTYNSLPKQRIPCLKDLPSSLP